MKVSVKHKGFGATRLKLRNLGELVPDAARGQMKRSAARIVDRAKIFVPEDEEHLKNSIRIEKTYGYRGRLQIDIVAGDMTITKANGRSVDLNRYAALVHEAYETYVTRANGPGEKTLKKMAENPTALIGSGFLRRAMEKERESIVRHMTEVIDQVVRMQGLR